MIYRKLKPEETTIQAGDVVAAKYSLNAVGEPAQTHLGGGGAFVLRPVPDGPEDVVRVEGLVIASHDSPRYQDVTITVEMPGEAKVSSLINQRVTLLIPRPDPPMPKCPYCGMELAIKHNDAGCWAECSYSNCTVVVIGETCPTRREAIEAMAPKGGGK
jgi:hypothetical protein